MRYLNHVADKFDLRRDIQFHSRVAAAHWQDDARHWDVTLEDGSRHMARFLITAVGPAVGADDADDTGGGDVRRPVLPHRALAEAAAALRGQARRGHRHRRDRRADDTGGGEDRRQLTVFQRTPNWCAPLHNGKISAEEMAELKRGYPEMFARCQETFACFLHTPDRRKTFDVTPEEREAFWEKLYAEKGFGIWQGNFRDILVNREANALLSDFVARKIRQRVKDQAVAEKLIPKNHGFGTRRVPLETRYYEVYNQPNVTLVDLNETPIERITPTGLRTGEREYEFDIIIYATGFDAITGSFDRIDISGIDGVRLKDTWAGGPRTFLGVMVEGFPNMLMLMGPHTALGNIPRSIEYNVDWVTGLLRFAREHGLTRVEATEAGVRHGPST